MKKSTLAFMAILLTALLTACAGGKFSAIEGELPADKVVDRLVLYATL